MDSQKRENMLNLALDITEDERERSLALNTGYNKDTKLWEVIVRYDGTIHKYENTDIEIIELIGGYAIITASKDVIDQLSSLPEIAYIEMPKRLYFSVDRGRAVSCISSLQTRDALNNNPLLGNGVIIAVLDSGIDYTHPDFINMDGTSRILYLWDQTAIALEGQKPPIWYHKGVEYNKEQIDKALRASVSERLKIVPEVDASGHGTAVASIAAGNGRGSDGQQRGIAPNADLIVVKLGVPKQDGFPRTTELMQAVDYAVRMGVQLQKPVSINISIGNTYGAHDGQSLIESYLNAAGDVGKCVINVGSGNEGAASGHTSGTLIEGKTQIAEFAISTYESKLNLQLWKYYTDQVNIEIVSPSGQLVGPFQQLLGTQRFILGNTEILLYYGEPAPYSSAQEIYFDFIPRMGYSYLNSGLWQIRIIPIRVVEGEYHIWMPPSGSLNIGTGFLVRTPDVTLTIPSTAAKVITVGAYDAALDSYASFSGRGYTRVSNMVKPDISAPGVGVVAASPGGGYVARSGTSFATPYVTGASALLMEWGIVRGNDPYLYGEKVKAYLINGAKQLPGYPVWPNRQLGYGALCVEDSLPL